MSMDLDRRNRAPRHGQSPWVRIKPAVSFMGTAPSLAVVASLAASGVRVVMIEGASSPRSPCRDGSACRTALRSRHDGLMPRNDGDSLIAALLDTSVTVIAAPIRAAARSLGLVLALKNGYHAVLAIGASGIDPAGIAAEIATASGKTLGPDFGLCCDCEPQRFTSGKYWNAEIGLVSSDRRAYETVRATYGALEDAVCFKSFNLR